MLSFYSKKKKKTFKNFPLARLAFRALACNSLTVPSLSFLSLLCLHILAPVFRHLRILQISGDANRPAAPPTDFWGRNERPQGSGELNCASRGQQGFLWGEFESEERRVPGKKGHKREDDGRTHGAGGKEVWGG